MRICEISRDLGLFRRADLTGCAVLVNIVTARAGYAAGNREIMRFHEILRDFRRICENL